MITSVKFGDVRLDVNGFGYIEGLIDGYKFTRDPSLPCYSYDRADRLSRAGLITFHCYGRGANNSAYYVQRLTAKGREFSRKQYKS